MKSRLLWIIFFSAVALFATEYFGNTFYFYWNSFWYDGWAHLLGGFVAGCLFVWIWFISGIFEKSIPTKREVFIVAFFAALFIGIIWEFFEYVYGIATPASANYAVDTFHDVMFDILGGVIAGIYTRKKKFYV